MGRRVHHSGHRTVGSGRIAVTVLMLVVALTASTSVTAQTQPTPSEVEANERALAAAAAGDLDQAIEILEALVAANGVNVYWLNLGRAYHRASRCEDAIRAYTASLTAPALADPPRAQVRVTVTKYLNELVLECPGRVEVVCTPPHLVVDVRREEGGDEGTVACGESVELLGGTWLFRGTYGGRAVEESVQVRAAQSFRVALDLSSNADIVAPTQDELRAPTNGAVLDAREAWRREDRSRGSRGLVFVGVGAAAFATGVALDGVIPGFPATARNAELDAMDFVPAALYLAAIPLVVVGILNLVGR